MPGPVWSRREVRLLTIYLEQGFSLAEIQIGSRSVIAIRGKAARLKLIGDGFLHERVPFSLPTENGYSMVGEVVEVGEGVTGFAVGDRVFAPCPHKQFAVVPAPLAIKLPDEIPDEEVVFMNILEVGHIAIRRGNPASGSNVAIVGQGVIGLSVLAYARAFGFQTAVVDKSPRRLEIAQEMGADLAVSADEPDFVDEIIDFFGGEGADLVVEAASNWSAIESCMEIARSGGKIVVAARHTDRPLFNPVGHPFLGKKLELLTSYGHEPDGHRWDRKNSFALTVDLLARKKLQFQPMITHRLDWDQLPEVYNRLHQGDRDMVGTVISWP